MKQVFLSLKNGKLEVAEIPTPSLRSGGILIKNYFSLISAGTEKSIIRLAQKNLIEKGRSRPDLIRQVMNKIKTEGLISTLKTVKQKLEEYLPLGYSCAGEVIAVGEGVEEFKIGDRVAGAGGGYASHGEVVFVPKNLCTKIPDNVSYQEACFATVAAIALEGIRILNLTAGERVGVIGLGLIGQLTVQILRAYGHPVIGFDLDPRQVKKSLELGLNKGVIIGQDDPLEESRIFTDNLGLDAIIITAATQSNQPIELAGELARKRGRISVVGDISINVPRKIYYEKELRLTVSCSYGPGRYDRNYEEKGIDYPFAYVRWTEKRNMQEFLRLLAEKKINVESLITHTFEINQALDAYNLILDNPDHKEIVGVLLKYLAETKIAPTVVYREISEGPRPKDHLNIGLIGVGNFAKTIVLPCLKRIKNVSLVAAADTDGHESASVIKKFNGRYATTDYHRIINDPDIDLVIVATRHNLHAQIAIEALRNNKNVHIEKPLCLSEEELKEIIEKAQGSRGRLMVGFNRRFAPHAIIAKKNFKQSKPLMICARMNAGFLPKEHWTHDPIEGGGRIVGEACHFIDLINFLAGARPVQVFATAVPLGGKIQTKDNVFVTIDFENGSRGCVLYTSLGNKNAPKEYIEIFGGDKVMTIDNFKSALLYTSSGRRKYKLFGQDKGHFNEFKTFIETIRQGLPAPIPLDELINSSLITLKAIESLRSGQPIRLI